MQNKHNFFLNLRGSQKVGVGWNPPTIWEKFPNNPVFFLGGISLVFLQLEVFFLSVGFREGLACGSPGGV